MAHLLYILHDYESIPILGRPFLELCCVCCYVHECWNNIQLPTCLLALIDYGIHLKNHKYQIFTIQNWGGSSGIVSTKINTLLRIIWKNYCLQQASNSAQN